jgi:hypothetical protein
MLRLRFLTLELCRSLGASVCRGLVVRIGLGMLPLITNFASPLRAESLPLYVWADSLTLHAAPSFSAPAVGDLAYGTAVEPLAPPGPLVEGQEGYPPLRDEGGEDHPLRGHWLKLRSATQPGREGYGFDLYLLPLPAPRCEPGRAFCDPVMAVDKEACPDGAKYCESVEAYSARTFGLVSQDRDDRAGRDWSARYGRGVTLEVQDSTEYVLYSKRWTLPMLRSIDQAYVVTRRFYGASRYVETYDPPRKIHLFLRHWDVFYLNVFLSRDEKGVAIDWGYVD